MTAINITYKGLTGLFGTVSVDTGDSLAAVAAVAIADEGLPAEYYANWRLAGARAIDAVNNASNSITELGITENDVLIAVLDDDETREVKQIRKLTIAQLKRQAGGDTTKPYYRSGNVFDRDLLPTQYSGDAVVDNPNPGGLAANRPWT